ncbi:MAG: hypothetical protein CMH16_13630 [Methylobacterium sp.]|nr:hypothetical protein [Methylobacterium sp.]
MVLAHTLDDGRERMHVVKPLCAIAFQKLDMSGETLNLITKFQDICDSCHTIKLYYLNIIFNFSDFIIQR